MATQSTQKIKCVEVSSHFLRTYCVLLCLPASHLLKRLMAGLSHLSRKWPLETRGKFLHILCTHRHGDRVGVFLRGDESWQELYVQYTKWGVRIICAFPEEWRWAYTLLCYRERIILSQFHPAGPSRNGWGLNFVPGHPTPCSRVSSPGKGENQSQR